MMASARALFSSVKMKGVSSLFSGVSRWTKRESEAAREEVWKGRTPQEAARRPRDLSNMVGNCFVKSRKDFERHFASRASQAGGSDQLVTPKMVRS